MMAALIVGDAGGRNAGSVLKLRAPFLEPRAPIFEARASCVDGDEGAVPGR